MLLSVAASQRCSRCLVKARRLELQQQRQRSTVRFVRDEHKPERAFRPKIYGSERAPRFSRGDPKAQTSPFRGIRKQSDNGADSGYHGALRWNNTKPRSKKDLSVVRNGDRLIFRKAVSFENALVARLMQMEEEQRDSRFIRSLAEQRDQSPDVLFKYAWKRFYSQIRPRRMETPTPWAASETPVEPVLARAFNELKAAFATRGERGLKLRLEYIFHDYLMADQFSPANLKMQKEVANLRHPIEWYPNARATQRTIHMHVGPTNSGKTYHALQKLEKAKKGVYAGPLRLLAYEVYQRMNAKNIPCALITGDDRRAPNGEITNNMNLRIAACTVEMVPCKVDMDVAVIDEIQMIADRDRGWAWTQAVLGVRAREIHLCGEERAVPIIEKLAAAAGEKLHIHRYERLSTLKMAEQPLYGDIKQLRKGDCVVCFSVQGIHAMKKLIEETLGGRVAIVYGSLPPETRAQQARLFNDPDSGYDYLVASDAVGMGLNLAIKRVVFESTSKHNGVKQETLDVASIKQIAGRAGRFRTAAQGTDPNATAPDTAGLVTTLDAADFDIVKRAMVSQPEPLRTAGISPTAEIVERFASYFPPNTPFTYIMSKLGEFTTVGQAYHLTDDKDANEVGNLIEPIADLTMEERYNITKAPMFRDANNTFEKLIPVLAKHISENSQGILTEIREIPLEVLDEPEAATRNYVRKLEGLHKSLVLYLWLSFQFEGTLISRNLANHTKGLVEEKLERALKALQYADRQAILEQRRARMHVQDAVEPEVLGSGEGGEESVLATDTVQEPIDEATEQLAEYGDSTEPQTPERRHDEERFDEFGRLIEESDLPTSDADKEVQTQSSETEASSNTSSSFAAWRGEQTPGESQGTSDPETDEDFVKRVTSSSA